MCPKVRGHSLQLQDGPGVSVGMDPANEVEVPHVEGAVGAVRQGDGRKQHHVPGWAVAARTAGDAPVEAVPHHGADHRGLLGEEDVLAVPFVKDRFGERNGTNGFESTPEVEHKIFLYQIFGVNVVYFNLGVGTPCKVA